MKPKTRALLKQIHSGQIKTDAARVLDHIKNNPYCTLPEIKRKLTMAHQTAAARLSDLLDMGIVEEQGEKKTQTSCYTYFKYQPDFLRQENNARKRKKQKYRHWLKKGLSQFQEFINPELKIELQNENNHELQT